MTKDQIDALEVIFQRELDAGKGPWEAALALVEHVQKRRPGPSAKKREALKQKAQEALQAIRDEYPEDAIHRIRPLLEEIEKAL